MKPENISDVRSNQEMREGSRDTKNHDETATYLASRYNGGLHFVTSQPSGVKHILVHEQDYI